MAFTQEWSEHIGAVEMVRENNHKKMERANAVLGLHVWPPSCLLPGGQVHTSILNSLVRLFPLPMFEHSWIALQSIGEGYIHTSIHTYIYMYMCAYVFMCVSICFSIRERPRHHTEVNIHMEALVQTQNR